MSQPELPSTREVRTLDPSTLDARPLAALWNESYGNDLALTVEAVRWAAQATASRCTDVFVVQEGQRVLGFSIVSAVTGEPDGWIDAICTDRGGRLIDVRTALVAEAEAWLRTRGCSQMRLGGGSRSLMRGSLPAPSRMRMWTRLGFHPLTAGASADMAVDIARYAPPENLDGGNGVVRTAAQRDREDVLSLLDRAEQLRSNSLNSAPAPGAIADLREHGTHRRISDFMLLWTPHGLRGLIQVGYADSTAPIEVAYPYRLPRQWSTLSNALVDEAVGEAGFDLLVDAALRRLHNTGVNSCVAMGIEATSLFERFGFREYRAWRPMVKGLPAV